MGSVSLHRCVTLHIAYQWQNLNLTHKSSNVMSVYAGVYQPGQSAMLQRDDIQWKYAVLYRAHVVEFFVHVLKLGCCFWLDVCMKVS